MPSLTTCQLGTNAKSSRAGDIMPLCGRMVNVILLEFEWPQNQVIKAENLFELSRIMQGTSEGVSLIDIQNQFGVFRLTAGRMGNGSLHANKLSGVGHDTGSATGRAWVLAKCE